MTPRALRAAVYTRKSHEEGLEQAFNSLDAQRESCEAYIRSQAGLGWVLVETRYDDGGFSGGNMDRPGLNALLADVEAGKIDIICLYKIDRLTRSLSDFSRIVEVLDKAGAEFVSVTQPLNTVTSMGRLMLNVLLSFAQFEREQTGERIRDKIKASKAKGLWMGGNLPLGYDAPGENRLSINKAEAETVRMIFARYLELGSVHRLVEELEREGVRSKAWVSSRGRKMGGLTIGRGALFHMLRNRIYVGDIVHKGQPHPGRHKPIIDKVLFDQVQAKLDGNRVRKRRSADRAAQALLKGKLYGGDGRQMSPTFSTGRRGTIHRYYVASALQSGKKAGPSEKTQDMFRDWPRRIPAGPLEATVLGWLRRWTGHPGLEWAQALSMLLRIDVKAERTEVLLCAEGVFGLDHPELAFEDLQGRLGDGERALRDGAAVRVSTPLRMSFRGGRCWLLGDTPAPRPNTALIRALRSAHEHLYRMGAPAWSGRQSWTHATGDRSTFVMKQCRLALLAPEIQRSILAGGQPAAFLAEDVKECDIPISWSQQRSWWAGLCRLDDPIGGACPD